MTRRYPAEWIDEITGVADHWVRKCNGQPENGLPVDRAALRVVLGQSDAIVATPERAIIWHASGREFTATPVPDHGMEAGAGAPA